MIVQILAELDQQGYLRKGRHATVAPFLPAGNVAFRRDALEQVDGFDPDCVTGEDCDVCARLSEAGWELFMHPQAAVHHINPTTLRHVVRQWYGYGRYHPYVFAKHNHRAVEVHVRLARAVEGERYLCLYAHRFPFTVVLFITRFLVLNLAAAFTAVSWALGCSTGGWAGLAATALAAVAYVWPDVKRCGPLKGIAASAVRYLADAALFVGGLIGGLRCRMLYLNASVD